MSVVKSITFESGSIVVTTDEGAPRRYMVKDILRAADIPVLTIGSLTLLTTLAQVVMVLVRTLIEHDILDENLVSGYDMQYVLDTLTVDLKAEDTD